MITFNKSLITSEVVDVALSMGEDSVAVSHFLTNWKKPIRLHYVNHGTEYSKIAESRFYEFCEFLKSKSKVNILEYVWCNSEIGGKLKSEAEFRNFRYDCFDSFFRELPTCDNKLVVCHHLMDAVESYLMNTMTSATYDRTLPVATSRNNYVVVRPFLLTPKPSISKYIDSKNLREWVVEDPSNSSHDYKRNWVRAELIPLIKTKYPGIEKVVRKIYL